MTSKKNSHPFQPIASRPHFGELTEQILQYWKQNHIFEKSVELRPASSPYVFYDGPPFVTGLPHYGHLLSSIAKDLIPRFWTMKGKRVRRVWGWDCHGLPIENKVEQKLKLNSRRDIEKIGLETFMQECMSYVQDISSEWNWYIDHIGRWVDMEHSYKTMDKNYMESVWWVFKQVYDKDLIYEGKRVSLYCTRCGTPISNFEVAMDNSYKEITEPANVYKYKLTTDNLQLTPSNIKKGIKTQPHRTWWPTDGLSVFILAWSTTPWNKLATPALTVNPALDYGLVKQGDEYYILAKTTLTILKDEPYDLIGEFKGSELEGLHFEPHYNFYDIPKDKEAWVIVGGDFVTAEEGTGVVTLAVYGEDDFKLMQEKNIAMLEHVDGEGHIKLSSKFKIQNSKFDWNGMYYLKANKLVNEDLTERGLMYREDAYTHTVPTCWRCATRLMFAPQHAWFIRVNALKEQMLATNESIYWFPDHLKHGRFKKGIESAPDWCISRSRYWATPMPVWQCQGKLKVKSEKLKVEEENTEPRTLNLVQNTPSSRFQVLDSLDGCGHTKVIGSLEELEKLTGKKVIDMHRPYIDTFTFPCDQCGGTMQRIPDVLDSWIDAGSMPYAERHYPFENKADFEASFPADYIVEYVAQTRAWFYVLHVLSNALFDSHGFKNVICTGVIQGTDGRKMSKSYGNYPDPRKVLELYGGDAFRLYAMSSSVMAAENLNISEEEIKEQNQRTLGMVWNCFAYFVTYANMHGFNPKLKVKSENILDQWIMIRLQKLTVDTEQYLTHYNVPKAVRLIRPFVTDLSTWYIRRSRDRFTTGDLAALSTLYQILWWLSHVLAPTTPFIAEAIYQHLKLDTTDKESVHLCDWPELSFDIKDEAQLSANMQLVREICTQGNEVRKQLHLPTRQALARVTIKTAHSLPAQAYIDLIAEELNVKQVVWQKDTQQVVVEFDTTLTPELLAEGEARKLIRQIQEARRKANVDRDAVVTVTLPSWPSAFEDEIKKKAMVSTLQQGDKLEIHC